MCFKSKNAPPGELDIGGNVDAWTVQPTHHPVLGRARV